MFCSCKESNAFRQLQKIFSRGIEWYNSNKSDESRIYDESWEHFSGLYRGQCQDILRILSNDNGDK